MTDYENTWDKLLQIQTTGRDDTNADTDHHPYEPTPYTVLERLAASGLVGQEDVVLDYGCGKGRVGFFLSYQTKAKTIGIEYDARIYQGALVAMSKPCMVPLVSFRVTSMPAFRSKSA